LLGVVPTAARAALSDRATDAGSADTAKTLGSLSADDVKLRCPAGTRAKWDGCLELTGEVLDPAAPAKTIARDQGGSVFPATTANPFTYRCLLRYVNG
jgi:hypothetical protein